MITTKKQHLFMIGDLTITQRAKSLADRNNVKVDDLMERHQSGDWGIVNDMVKNQNDFNLAAGGSIYSVFNIAGELIQILTSKSRKQTFVFTEWDLF